MYKILAKLLANRLKKVLENVIDISYIVLLVANKVIEEAKRQRKKCLVFKVDYEKAYDSVNWEFLYYMLGRFEGKMGRMDMSVFGL